MKGKLQTLVSLGEESADCKRGRRKGATSRNVKNRQKVSKSVSTLFGNFRAGQKTSKIVKKCQNIFRHFSTIFARHQFSGPFWGALKKGPDSLFREVGVFKDQQGRSTPTPWARGLRDQIQKRALQTENPSCIGFTALGGPLRPWSENMSETMVSEWARPWGRGRSEFAKFIRSGKADPDQFEGVLNRALFAYKNGRFASSFLLLGIGLL